jgi:hypothetical protein
MTKEQIIEKIKSIENGLAATEDPNQVRLLRIGLSRYNEMLSQKKSEVAQAQQVQPEKAQEKQIQEQVIVNQKIESSFNLEVQKVEIILYQKEPIGQTEQQLQDYTRKYFGVVLGMKKFQDGLKNGNIDCLLSSISFYNLCQYFAGLKRFRKTVELEDVLIYFSKYSGAKKKEAQILLDYMKSKAK